MAAEYMWAELTFSNAYVMSMLLLVLKLIRNDYRMSDMTYFSLTKNVWQLLHTSIANNTKMTIANNSRHCPLAVRISSTATGSDPLNSGMILIEPMEAKQFDGIASGDKVYAMRMR